MKNKIFTFIALFLMSQAGFAGVEDSVSYSAGYADDVYYSFTNGTVKTEARANWEIGFSTSKVSSSILINGGSGVELFSYPSGDTAAWSTVDTAGISTWNSMMNSEESWEEGAFSAYASGHPDYGWGIYNQVTHNLTGDSLFIIKMINGDYKKLWIVSKQSAASIYTFRLANIDGTSDTTIILNCNPYDAKNYIYYSIEDKMIKDRDPDSDSWDILFTKYVAAQPSGGYYTVTGVLSNMGVEVSKVEEEDTSIVNWADYAMMDTKSVIGWDWKEFNMGTFSYDVSDSLLYFVKNLEGDVYKLIFTGFVGSSTGNVYFKKELISATSIQNVMQESSIKMYPNPAEDYITIELNAVNNDTRLSVFDISGRLVIENSNLRQTQRINVSTLNSGVYFIKLENGNKVSVEKFIVK